MRVAMSPMRAVLPPFLCRRYRSLRSSSVEGILDDVGLGLGWDLGSLC